MQHQNHILVNLGILCESLFSFGRSITNPVSSSTMTTGGFSEPKTPTAVSVPRRILLRSIFEWNSGPTTTIVPNSCTDGTIQPLNMPVDVVATSSIACPSKQLSNQRFVAPVNSICSPLPNRRLQQLNPLFMSTGSTNDIPDLSCMSTQPMQVVPLFNRMTELDQGSNSVTQNVIATTCYNNTIQQQDKIAANYTRAGSGLPHSKAPSVNQHCSHESHLSGTTHRVPISCHCQPTTDVLPIDISRQPQQQQQISSSLLTPSTTQTAPIVSVYNDSFVTSSMGTSFSLRAYNVNQKSNEEHNLIARYAAQLAAASALNQEFDKLGDFVDSTQTQKQLIAQLQEKNRSKRTASASKSLKLHSGGRRPYLGQAFQTEEKTVLFNHNSTNVIRLSSNHSSHQTNHSDSGSDAYLYSDPELCFTITSMTCPSQSGVSTLQAAVQLSPLPSASTVVSKSSKTSRDLLGCLSDKTVTTTPIVDNYEYAGSHPCSVPPLSYFQDEHVRHRRNNTLSIPATTNL
ncbi:unnamed protein product [Heterobilharzia americana]|nr:unnamed protein product [Heterobilharzia americana]